MATPESITLEKGHEKKQLLCALQAPDAQVQWHYLIVTLLYYIFQSHLSNGLSLLVVYLLYNTVPCYGRKY